MNQNLENYKFLEASNFPKPLVKLFWDIISTYPLPKKRLKLVNKITPKQISGILSSHLMSVARKCEIPHIYIGNYSDMKKDLARKYDPECNSDKFWIPYIKKAEKDLPMKTINLITAIKSTKIWKKRIHNLPIILKQESINNKIKKVKRS